MPIPDYQSCMLPLLRFASDAKEHTLGEAVDVLANEFGLTSAERSEMLPSGSQQVFHNRLGWARTYMKKAGLLEAPKRGVFKISNRGQEVLAQSPSRIDVKFLEQFPEFIAFREATRNDSSGKEPVGIDAADKTPEEILEIAHQNLRKELA